MNAMNPTSPGPRSRIAATTGTQKPKRKSYARFTSHEPLR